MQDYTKIKRYIKKKEKAELPKKKSRVLLPSQVFEYIDTIGDGDSLIVRKLIAFFSYFGFLRGI